VVRDRRADAMKAYRDLATRGRKVATEFRTSAPTRQAIHRIDTARGQLRTTLRSTGRTASATATTGKATARAGGKATTARSAAKKAS
jgi:hypothetical protein